MCVQCADGPLLTLDSVSFAYREGKNHVQAVKRASGEFWPGKLYTIVGRSGSGKSTLLSIVAGLEVAGGGNVRVCGEELRAGGLDQYRRHKVGMVFQSFNLLPQLTALENVALAMDIAGWVERDSMARASALLGRVGIDAVTAGRRPLHLSGGEQQRVAIARALAVDPPLIIADEPTGNLDDQTGAQIIQLLSDLAHVEGRCVIVATHSAALSRQADEVWFMQDGQLLPGTP